MKKQILMSLILGSFVAVSAHAEEQNNQNANTSTVKVSDVQKKDETEKDIDNEITNARMRAQLGSKSKWSFKSSLGYSGSTVDKPFERVRPNIMAGPDAPQLASIDGSIGVNYRINAADSLYFSTGVSIQEPLHGSIGESTVVNAEGKNEKKIQLTNPGLSYSKAYRAAGMQNVTSFTYSHATTDYSVNSMKMIGSLGFSQTVLADLGESAWSGGLSFSATYLAYYENAPNQYDLTYGVYPFAEYTFNDTYSFRTVFGYFNNVHMKSSSADGDPGAILAEAPYQSMGIGISITRDIYLYPNVQFIPLDIRGDRTNVALSTNINLF